MRAAVRHCCAMGYARQCGKTSHLAQVSESCFLAVLMAKLFLYCNRCITTSRANSNTPLCWETPEG